MNVQEKFIISIPKIRDGMKNKMAKSEKMKTPDWILEGYDSEEDYNKKKGIIKKKKDGKTFKLKRCPKCESDEVKVKITGEEGKGGEWECHKCKWQGKDIKEDELTEDEFMEYLDSKGEEVS
jgi:ribosomal protein L37AE/L43A